MGRGSDTIGGAMPAGLPRLSGASVVVAIAGVLIAALAAVALLDARGDSGRVTAGEALGLIAYVSTADGNFEIYVIADRKSTRLNSSHGYISYAVFCLQK